MVALIGVSSFPNDVIVLQMVKRYSIFLLSLSLFINQQIFAQGGGIDSSFGINGVKKVVIGISHKGGVTNPLKSFGDSLNRIIIVGQTTIKGVNHFFATRWLADGSLDSSFGNSGTFFIPITSANTNSFAIQQLQDDGKLLLAGTVNTAQLKDIVISRYLSNGALDAGFGNNGQTIIPVSYLDDIPSDLVIAPDGKIVIAATTALGISGIEFATIRLRTNGLLDSSFNLTGIAKINISGNDNAKKVLVQSDGKIIVGGETTLTNIDLVFARYLLNGTLDSSFGNYGKISYPVGSGDDLLMDLKLMPDGKLMALAQAEISATTAAILHLNANGSVNTSFGLSGVKSLNFMARQLLLDSSGTFYTHYPIFGFVRKYLANGNPDTSFGANGIYDFLNQIGGLSVFLIQLKDRSFRCIGNIGLGTGINKDLVVAGVTLNGQVLHSFGQTGIKTENFDFVTEFGKFVPMAQTVLNDGSLIVGGSLFLNSLTYFVVTKFKANGERDSSFATFGSFITNNHYSNSTPLGFDVKVRPDNNLQVLYSINLYPSNKVYTSLYMLNPFGVLVRNFGDSGYVNDTIQMGHLNFQSDGKIIADVYKRYFPDGKIDTSFHGYVFIKDILAVSVLKNDYILLSVDTMVMQLNPNGAIDASFGTGGHFSIYYLNTNCFPASKKYYVRTTCITQESSGKIMLGGFFSGAPTCNGARTLLIRLNENGTPYGPVPFLFAGYYYQNMAQILLPDSGYILYGTNYGGVSPYNHGTIKRVYNNGTFDSSYSIAGSYKVQLIGSSAKLGSSILTNINGRKISWLRTVDINNDTLYLARIKVDFSPLIDFSAYKTNPGFGDTIKLISASYVTVKAYKWYISPDNFTFLQGTDSTSANPVLKFHKAGLYSISLKVFYDDTFSTITKTNYISLIPFVNFTADKTLLNFNDTVRFQASFNGWPTGLKWNLNTTNFSYLAGTDSTSSSPVIKFNSSGKFDVQLMVNYTDSTLMLNKPQYIEVLPQTGITENIKDEIFIYPNPTHSTIVIESNGLLKDAICEVYDIQGRLFQNYTSTANDKWTIILPENPGVYFLKINTVDGKQWVRKVVKE
ncbi:MAG: T9SS type A sorting domain-containing protein [Bacteroidota bacterium]|nr:T9SS type A sorting domain-containing protein [Bacteroidota bacterium]